MDLIETKDDANLAMSCIAKKLRSLTAGSATLQEGASGQHATSSFSSSSPAQAVKSSLPAEAEPTAVIASEMPESPSTDSAVSTITQSQQSSAPTEDTTLPPPAEAELTAAVTSEVSQPSSPITAPANPKPVASAQSTTSPPSTEAESPAPVQSVVVNPSSTAAAHRGTTRPQHPSAPIAAPHTSPVQPTEAPIAHNTTQSKQPLTPATAPQSSAAKPNRSLYSADQLTPSSCSLQPTHSPTRGALLDYELAVRVGTYSSSTTAVVSKLVEHGGRKHDLPLRQRRSVPLAENLSYLDFFRTERKMVVQRDKFRDHNGSTVNISHVSCNQYLDLYNSMMHRNPSDLDTTCRKILAELEIAIVNRAAVYKWYESLPTTDGRVAYNPRHLAFLQMF